MDRIRYRLVYRDIEYQYDITTKQNLYIILRDLTGMTTRELLREQRRIKKHITLPSNMMVGAEWIVLKIFPDEIEPMRKMLRHKL